MAVTLFDLYHDVRAALYGHVEVKEDFISSNANIGAADSLLTCDPISDARRVQRGTILEFVNNTTLANELVRVTDVDTSTGNVTFTRAVNGTTNIALADGAGDIRINPEFPASAILKQINNTITGLAPDVWAFKTLADTVGGFYEVGYELPTTAVGVVSVQYLLSGPSNQWEHIRRYRWDPSSKQVDIFEIMQPGQDLRIVYRAYPTALAAYDDELTADAGLDDSMRDLIVWGAVHKLLLTRAGSRLIDTRAETPMNGEYRRADAVTATVRQVYQQYQLLLVAARERQRHENPVRPHLTF